MKAYFKSATPNSPKVLFDPENNIFEISGDSRPEHVSDFYEPIYTWIDNYLEELISQNNKNQIVFKIQLNYFNSASEKALLRVVKKLYPYITSEIPVTIEWYSIEDDDDMRDVGEDFQDLSKVPFIFKTIPND